MRKLTPKEYRKREKILMRRLGMRPQPLSGAGWIRKEDGEDDNFLVQLKSTQADSIGLKMKDIQILFDHAQGVAKTPLFMVDFVDYNVQLVCIRLQDIAKVKLLLPDQVLEQSAAETEISLSDLDVFPE